MVDFVPSERATPIRVPSTANLLIESSDRNVLFDLQPNNFVISKKNSILNGFFTRIGVTEMSLRWCTPNVSTANNNNFIILDISGAAPYLVNIPTGFYNVYQAINAVATVLNDASGVTGLGFSVSGVSPLGGFALTPSNLTTYYGFEGILASQLSLGTPDAPFNLTQGITLVTPSSCLSILRFSYLDFISDQLTYNQELKDASTQDIESNILVRFYFCNETPEQLDTYGFPILMGYSPFNVRRTFNPPKQIKWEPNMPIGQIGFRVLDDSGQLAKMYSPSNWGMVLQVSEV